MKVNNKVAVTVVPIILIAIIILNLVFVIFFKSFIIKNEELQQKATEENVSSYIQGQIDRYKDISCDWGHMDITYEFIFNSENSPYILNYLNEDAYRNRNINFFVFTDLNNKYIYNQYYDLDHNLYADFPAGFLADFTSVLHLTDQEPDANGIFKLGDHYYLLAATDITDSIMFYKPNGKLIIGKQIDEGVIQEIESISDCKIIEINTLAAQDHTVSSGVKTNNDNREIKYINLTFPGSSSIQPSVVFTLAMKREFYLSGVNSIYGFAVINTLISVVLSLFTFYMLGRYLKHPFDKLMSDVKSVDPSGNNLVKLQVLGNDEFAYLRSSINGLLTRIEADQQELVFSKERLHATLQSVGDGVISVDKEGKVLFMNPIAQNMTGWTISDAENKPVELVFNIVDEFTKQPVKNPVIEVFETDNIISPSNHTLLVSKHGIERSIENTAAPIKDRDGKMIGCVLILRDFSERKEKQKEIEYLSYHDQLTGLFNRRFFEDELKRLDNDNNLPLSFIYADLNGLKIINDAFGHESGDKVIKTVAQVFMAECPKEGIAARIGGDEFVILLPKTGLDIVESKVHDIKNKIEKKKVEHINLSISFGWDTKTDARQNAADVLRSAEDYMYQKKIFYTASKRNGIIKSILNALLLKCPREEAHSVRVSTLCESIGKAFNLSEDDINELKIAGELHDIGKIAVDAVILNKQEELSKPEWSQIKHHPEIGYRLLGATSEFINIAEYVLAHHERWDGKGYPKKLKGEAINWKSRAIAVADAYDAMTSARPYHKALTTKEAVEELKKNAGTQFDPQIVKVFVEKVLNAEF